MAARCPKRQASPTFWTRRLRQVVSSDIECDSPVRSSRRPRDTMSEPAGDISDCSPTAPWPDDSRFRSAGMAASGAPIQQGPAASAWVASRAIPQLLRLYSLGVAQGPPAQQSDALPPLASQSPAGVGPAASRAFGVRLEPLPVVTPPAAPVKEGGQGDSSAPCAVRLFTCCAGHEAS